MYAHLHPPLRRRHPSDSGICGAHLSLFSGHTCPNSPPYSLSPAIPSAHDRTRLATPIDPSPPSPETPCADAGAGRRRPWPPAAAGATAAAAVVSFAAVVVEVVEGAAAGATVDAAADAATVSAAVSVAAATTSCPPDRPPDPPAPLGVREAPRGGGRADATIALVAWVG